MSVPWDERHRAWRRWPGPRKRIRGRNNVILDAGARLRATSFDIEGSGNRIVISPGCSLAGVHFRVRGDGHAVHIGQDCQFRRGAEIWLEDEACDLRIGKASTFEQVHLAITEPGSQLSIGNDCMFADGIDVRTGDSHGIWCLNTGDRINPAADVHIGDHVWVASRCLILKGVTLGRHTVVATGSVVTKPFTDEGTIIGGNPARRLHAGVRWTRERGPPVA